MKHFFFLPVAVLVAAAVSPAAWSFELPAGVNCVDPSELRSSAEDCDDNKVYIEAAQRCLQSYEAYAKSRSEALKKKLEAAGAALDKVGANQKNDFGGSSADYQQAQQTLQALIDTGELVNQIIEKYLDEIVFPEDFDAPKELIGEIEPFLAENACYAETRKAIEGNLDELDGKLDELDDTKDIAAGMEAKATSRKSNTGSLSAPQVSGGQAQGAGTPKKKSGDPKNGPSTITGVEEDKKKQNK